METPIEKGLEWLFKGQQKTFAGNEHNLLNTINSKQDPWPSKIISAGLKINVGITNGFRYFVVTSHKIKPINKNIVFIHGGGFIGEITQQHWLYIKNLIKHTQSRVYVPIYPLTTDKYSSQLDTIHFLVDFYKEITQNDSESFYYIMGDSAGGNFALVLAQQIKIFNLKKPEHLILLSPCVSMENSPEAEKQGINDPILTYNLLKTLTHWQLKDADPKNPLFSPIYGDSKDIGDIHIFIGSREFFLYFVNQWTKTLDKFGVKYTIDICKDLFHNYPIFLIGKNAKSANEKIHQIINS